MRIDGKDNVRERIKVFENDRYITYLYIFENGNKYTDTVPKWKQTDMSIPQGRNADECLEKSYWKKI